MNVYIKDPYVAKYVTGEKVSISSMFYEQLLFAKIPKVQK